MSFFLFFGVAVFNSIRLHACVVCPDSRLLSFHLCRLQCSNDSQHPNWNMGRFLLLMDDCVRKHADPRLSGYHVRRRKGFSTPKKIEQRFEWLRKQVNKAWMIYFQAMEEQYEELEDDWLQLIRGRSLIQSQHHRRQREEAGSGRKPFSGKYDWVPNGWHTILEVMEE